MAVRAVQVADVVCVGGDAVAAYRRGCREDERMDEEQSDRRGKCAEVKENAVWQGDIFACCTAFIIYLHLFSDKFAKTS